MVPWCGTGCQIAKSCAVPDTRENNSWANLVWANLWSQFSMGMLAPTSGTVGDGESRSGPCSHGDESGPDCCMVLFSLKQLFIYAFASIGGILNQAPLALKRANVGFKLAARAPTLQCRCIRDRRGEPPAVPNRLAYCYLLQRNFSALGRVTTVAAVSSALLLASRHDLGNWAARAARWSPFS